MADDVLREQGLAVLERELGPTQALRFLAMVSRQPFDYQKWRHEHFDEMNANEIFTKAKSFG